MRRRYGEKRGSTRRAADEGVQTYAAARQYGNLMPCHAVVHSRGTSAVQHRRPMIDAMPAPGAGRLLKRLRQPPPAHIAIRRYAQRFAPGRRLRFAAAVA